MHSLRRLIFVATIAVCITSALAYQVPKRSLEARVHSADLVAIGTIIALDPGDPNKPDILAIATVRVDSILKGAASKTIHVVYREGIQESDPICCNLGGQYFMMLSRSKTGLYTSVDGRYGMSEIVATETGQDNSTSWPGSPAKKPVDCDGTNLSS